LYFDSLQLSSAFISHHQLFHTHLIPTFTLKHAKLFPIPLCLEIQARLRKEVEHVNKKLIAAASSALILGTMIAPTAFAASVNYGIGEFSGTSSLGNTDLKKSIASLINVALGFLGILAVLIILWGGFNWMTAAGDEKKVGKAKQIIIQGVIGLVIILSSWAIATFVIQNLATATGQTAV